jgi:hypothetical protein
LPGVITPVPPENIPVRLELTPALTVAGIATKLVIVASDVTVNVIDWLIAFPPPDGVTVRVYMVVAVGLTLTGVPLETVRLPGVITPVPFAKTPVRFVLAP